LDVNGDIKANTLNLFSNISANNLPGVKFSGCSKVDGGEASYCFGLGSGKTTDVDKITVTVPETGFLFITASIDMNFFGLSDGVAQFNLFKCNDAQCGDGVYLIRSGADHVVSNLRTTTITYTWVLSVAPGPVTLKTNATNDNVQYNIVITSHSLTAIYLPKQY
jgi:hypothetical protein